MRHGSSILRFLASYGVAVALLAGGVTAHAQGTRVGGGSSGFGGSSMGSSGFGGGGGQGGGSSLGSSNGFGNSSNGQFSFAGGQSFAGSSSQSFAGGSSGSSFTGGSSSGGFTGGSSFSGSTGGYGGGSFRGGSSSGGVSTMNPFYSTYGNPLGSGLASGSTVAFGQPLYSNLNPTTTNLIGSTSSGLGGAARIGGGGGLGGGMSSSSSGQAGGSYGAFGVVNRNSVVASLPAGPGVAAGYAPGRLRTLSPGMQADLRSLVSRSDVSPATKSAVTFGLDGNTLVLRGAATDAAEARAIESLMRYAPGVHTVRNEMTWK